VTTASTRGPIEFARPLDLARMRRERHARLVDAMHEQGVDLLVLLGQSNVGYATGASVPAADQGRAIHRRPVAVVTADGDPPHVFTWHPERVPPEHPADRVHVGLQLEREDGTAGLLELLFPGTLAVDELTMPLRAVLSGRTVTDVSPVLGAAKIVKTADEIECIRRAQAVNEGAIIDVHRILAPGVRGTELTGRLLARAFELGATSNTVDPVWQAMPAAVGDGPYSATGDVVFPTVTTDRPFAAGDVVWVDNGLCYEGYQSDYGNTWVVGGEVDARQRSQFARWRATTDAVLEAITPGATARDLTRAACDAVGTGGDGGRRPWLRHLYLAHGTGTDSAEMPLVGTDLGDDFDESVVLAPGMVLVLEPVIWDDGYAGFRAEEIVAVTDDGREVLSNTTYESYA
jgi:Xaa-Pro aminopeptidase